MNEQVNQKVVERTATARRKKFVPRCDVIERGDAIVLVLDMPGADEKSVELKLERNTLTVIGHAESVFQNGERALLREYNEGDFERTFSISEDLDSQSIDASMRDGVLQVVIPKSPQVKPRKITVRSE